MSIDRYTKAVLTVIALCLVWLCAGGPSLIPPVGAQTGATEVVVVGWRDTNGEAWKLPSPVVGFPLQGDLTVARERALQGLRAGGVRMPVDSD